MPERYKKRMLQRPGQETQSITERPSETYQLELPDFRIPTVTNSEDSVMTGLENRKWRDIWEHEGRASGINNTDEFLQQKHPSLFLLPFAPEVMGSGLGLGVLKTLGGYAGSYVGSKIGNEVGYALDNAFNKQLFEPLGEIVGGFSGFGKGYNLFEKAGMQGALKYLSNTGKEIPRWFMRPELRTNVGRINRRTFFAEDQTPKYNPNQLQGLNKQPYQSPSVSQLEIIPQAGFMSNIRYGYASPTATRGTLKQLDNFIENDVFPRLQRAGHNVTYSKTTMPTLRQFDPAHNPMDKYLLNNDPIARNSQGMFHSPTNTAMTIDKPSEANYGLLAHEIPGHAVRYNINPSYKPVTPEVFTKVVYGQPLNKAEDQILLNWNNADQLYTPIEESLLKTSYEPFFRGGDAEGKLHDYGAVNTQLRALISQKNNYAVDSKLDPYIDNFQDVELLKMLLEQPYTRNGTTQILKDTTGLKYLDNLGDVELTNILSRHPELSKMLKRIKDTMKYVAGVSAVGIGMSNIPQKQ